MLRFTFERLVVFAAVWLAIARFGAVAVQVRSRRIPRPRLSVVEGGRVGRKPERSA